MNYPQQSLNYMLDVVFPVRCVVCGRFSVWNKREYLCKSCIRLISLKKDFECIGCSRSSPLGKTCIECRDVFYIDQLFIVSDYKNQVVEKVIKTLKYRFIEEIAVSLSPVLKRYLVWLTKNKKNDVFADSPLLVPLPLHYRRLNQRGFNQAEIIAGLLADILLCKVETDLLVRTRQVKAQADIKDRGERLKNVANIFKLTPGSVLKVKNRTVILLDDICTTGATLNEAARVLKEKGAGKIVGFVIARG